MNRGRSVRPTSELAASAREAARGEDNGPAQELLREQRQEVREQARLEREKARAAKEATREKERADEAYVTRVAERGQRNRRHGEGTARPRRKRRVRR